MTRNRTTFAFLFLLTALSVTFPRPAPADDWPRWRGPTGDAVSRESVHPERWPKGGPRVLWKKNVGEGFAPVAVAGGKLYTSGNSGGTDTVYCLDAATGEQRWTFQYDCPPSGHGYPGPATGPTVDGDRVYVQSRVGHYFCLDTANGKVVWSKTPEDLKITRGPRHWYGTSCHAAIEGDLLIVETGGEAGVLAAFNKHTGKLAWQSGDEQMGYASPVVADVAGRRTVVAFTPSALIGVDVRDGKPLWRFPVGAELHGTIASPIVHGDDVFVSCWHWKTGSALVRVGKDGTARQVWENAEMRNHANTSLLWDGHIYGFDGYYEEGERLLRCLDFKTGEETWSAGGMGTGSLICAAGTSPARLVIMSETGELVVAEASPEKFKRLARKQILGGKSWTPPALANGKLYVRNAGGDVACLEIGGPEQPQ